MTNTFDVNNTLPYLILNAPQCGHCYEYVIGDTGSIWCENCLVYWNDAEDEMPAIPQNLDENLDAPLRNFRSRHESRYDTEYDRNGRHYVLSPERPCILPVGHSGDHRNPYTVTEN